MNLEFIIRMLIVIIGIFGMLLMATGQLKRKPRKEFLFYFTNLSNVFIIFYFLFNVKNNSLLFLGTLYITYTMIVFNCAIYPYLLKNNLKLKDVDMDILTSNIAHAVVPLLSLVYWFRYSKEISYCAIAYGYIIPILYLFFAISIGKSGYKVKDSVTNYIYPFLDIDKLGFKKVLINCIFMTILLTAIGILLICLR